MEHSAEFRRQALELARQGGKSIAELALDLGVSPTTIRKWLDSEGPRGPMTGRPDHVRRELEELRRQVRSLTTDVELLKCVALQFTEPSAPSGSRARAR